MELREWKKSKCSDNVPKKEGDNYFKNQINILLSQIKINKILKSDIPFVVIQYFSNNTFRPITQNEIIKYISNPKLFPSLTKGANLREEIISALRNAGLDNSEAQKIVVETHGFYFPLKRRIQ